jgi:hypothetical protein
MVFILHLHSKLLRIVRLGLVFKLLLHAEMLVLVLALYLLEGGHHL